MILARSIVFNALFYLVLAIYLIPATVALALPRRVLMILAQSWARTSLWMLRVVCGVRVEWRGLEKLPSGPLLIAAKHQSAWDTFALLALVREPTYILKRELLWIPFYGWAASKAGMIPVDRGAGKQALVDMTARVKAALRSGRQIIIFPEGTRRAPGAAPAYKFGVTHLYVDGGAPCLPVALNSGLFWPRRKWLRLPGTIVVELLDPIPPGLDRLAFSQKMQSAIETASDRLLAEGRRDLAARGLPDVSQRETPEP